MDAPAFSPNLPAVRMNADGTRRVDYRAIFLLAWPLVLNTSIQALLNVTDTWFVGRISSAALGAVGATFFLVLVFVVLLGGVGQAVQTLAAQAYGAGARQRAASYGWNGLWASVVSIPLFAALAFGGGLILSPFGLEPEIAGLAQEYWWPRLLMGWLGTALWGLSGFFNGISRTRLTLIVAIIVAASNVVFNHLLIFEFGLGVAGAAWATGLAQLTGVLALIVALWLPRMHAEFRTRTAMRPRFTRVWGLFKLGLPMGLSGTADLSGFALFQLMLARFAALDAAASQVVIMLTSICFMPAVGIALAGTTLVGQSIGAGDKDWAKRTGSAAIRVAVFYMGGMGLLLAAAGPWLMPFFVAAEDPGAAGIIELGMSLLWIAAAYQVFDGLNLGCAFCLRGAGDVRFPAILLIFLAGGMFIPASHAAIFGPGQGLVSFLPQFGLGARGAWWVAVVYVVVLGSAMWLRWLSGAWKKHNL